MNRFYEEAAGIFRLRVPFGTIYTSVFLLQAPSGPILVDCATTETDVDLHIVPALQAMGYSLSDIQVLVLTHRHDDHAGGLTRVLQLAPRMKVVREARPLCDGIATYPMAGHTEDCIGVLDTRSHTLISGDGLQGAGVDKYRCYLKNPKAYLQTIRAIQADERVETILFSHAYEPWNKDAVRGRAAVMACLSECKTYVTEE